MKVTMTLAVQPGNVKNLLNVCDGRKSAKHEVYGSVQITLSQDLMRWYVCRDGRTLAWLDFPIELGLAAPIEVTIHDGTAFLKAIPAEPFEVTLSEDLLMMRWETDDGNADDWATTPHAETFIVSPTKGSNSFRRIRNLTHDRWGNNVEGHPAWTSIGFEAADASMFGQMKTSAGKPTTVTLTCEAQNQPGASFQIRDSLVRGMTCLNLNTTEWSPVDE